MKEDHRPSGLLQAISVGIGIALLVASGLAAMAYIYWYGPCDQERCGQFGDFLGGVLNPIIGVVTLCALVWTVKAQSETLQLTRQALRLSQQQATAEASRNFAIERSQRDEQARVKAIGTYEAMIKEAKDALSVPLFDFGNRRYCVLDVLQGVLPVECLNWWLETPPENRGSHEQLYGESLAVKVKLAVSAAEDAMVYFAPLRWEAERRQLLTMIVICFCFSLLSCDELSKLTACIDAGDPTELIRRFDGASNRQP